MYLGYKLRYVNEMTVDFVAIKSILWTFYNNEQSA